MEGYIRMSQYRPRSHILRWVIKSGPNDPVLNLFHFLGPLLITVVAVVGRTTATASVVTSYLVVVVVYIIYKSYHREN